MGYEGSVRIGELSRTTGVPVPTIKYYVREGLLPAGTRTHPNQVDYTDTHAHRLRLVRAMVEVGRLPIGRVRELLAEVDEPTRGPDTLYGILGAALLTSAGRTEPVHATETERAEIERWLADRGFRVPEGYAEGVAEVLATFRRLGVPELAGLLDGYATAAMAVAEVDLAVLAAVPDRDAAAETMIVGTVLGDALFAALRRIAQATVSARVFPGPPDQSQC